MIYLDANVVLRYLLADDEGQHIISKNVIDSSPNIFILDGKIGTVKKNQKNCASNHRICDGHQVLVDQDWRFSASLQE